MTYEFISNKKVLYIHRFYRLSNLAEWNCLNLHIIGKKQIFTLCGQEYLLCSHCICSLFSLEPTIHCLTQCSVCIELFYPLWILKLIPGFRVGFSIPGDDQSQYTLQPAAATSQDSLEKRCPFKLIMKMFIFILCWLSVSIILKQMLFSCLNYDFRCTHLFNVHK